MDNKMNNTSKPVPFTDSDLPIDDDGRVYHLQITADQLAPDILIVGDPGRAEMIGRTFLHDIEVEQENRGLVTVTGLADITGNPATIISPLRATVTTSGMGAPSTEIIAQELAALNEIDAKTRMRKQQYQPLNIIRVGTSGALQAATRLGTAIITSYAIGLDNSGLFYEAPYLDDSCRRLEDDLDRLLDEDMDPRSRFFGRLRPYVTRADPLLVNAMQGASQELGTATKVGLTISNSGFFAPQGRDVARVRPSIPDLDKLLGEFDPRLDGQRIENMEMESAFLIHFMNSLGYRAAAICTTIANRREDTFDHDYQNAIRDAIRTAFLALAMVRKNS